jgi:gas vesicle protein
MLKEYLAKANEEKKRKEKLAAAKKVGAGLAVGAAVGLAAGVLLTPKSGKEIREDIAEIASDVTIKGIKVIRNKKGQISELREMVKENITDRIKNVEASVEGADDKLEKVGEDLKEGHADVTEAFQDTKKRIRKI